MNKPAGLLVHGTQNREQESTLVDWLVEHYPEIKNVGDDPEIRPGIVHRLDKETSGVMIVAKTQQFFEYLKNLFQNHQVQKTYLALVFGRLPKKGLIEKPIGLRSGTVKHSTSAQYMKMIKEAVTEYKAVRYLRKNEQEFSLVQLMPKTGRTHQLRVHLASIGHPVMGDKLYGKSQLAKSKILGLERQFLHAQSIEFNLVDGQKIKLEADLPTELKVVLDKLTEIPKT